MIGQWSCRAPTSAASHHRELMPVLCAEEDAALGDVAGGEEGDENSGEE